MSYGLFRFLPVDDEAAGVLGSEEVLEVAKTRGKVRWD